MAAAVVAVDHSGVCATACPSMRSSAPQPCRLQQIRESSVMVKMQNRIAVWVWAAAAVVGSASAWAHPDAAHVAADGAWARASVAGQQASGAFVRLTAQEPLRLVGVETPVAERGELHEMQMQGDVMRMRRIDGLELPPHQTVELKPGGYHVMLQQLKAPLQAGTQVPLTLVFTDAKGATSRLHLQVPVQRMAPPTGAGMPAAHGGHGH